MSEDDPVTAALDEIRERDIKCWHNRGNVGGLLALTEARDDVPRLLALTAKLLEDHKPAPLYALEPEPGKECHCGHDENAGCHFEANDGEWLCNCQPEGFVCGWCSENLIDTTDAEWPCRVYTAAALALSGEDGQ